MFLVGAVGSYEREMLGRPLAGPAVLQLPKFTAKHYMASLNQLQEPYLSVLP